MGLGDGNLGDLLKEKVYFALEVLIGDWLIDMKGTTDSRQYFYFIKIYYPVSEQTHNHNFPRISEKTLPSIFLDVKSRGNELLLVSVYKND